MRQQWHKLHIVAGHVTNDAHEQVEDDGPSDNNGSDGVWRMLDLDT